MDEGLREATTPWRRGPLNEIEKTLAKEVQGFWNEKAFSDVDIHCGVDGGVIQAHCLVLASISPVLKSVLLPVYDKSVYDSERTVLIVPEVSSTTLTKFLDSLYKGSCDEAIVEEELEFLKFTTENIHGPILNSFELSNPNDSKSAVLEVDHSNATNNSIWNYFSTVDKKLATCDDCSQAILLTPDASWGDNPLNKLSYHLKTFHPLLFQAYQNQASEDKSGGRYGKRKRKNNDFDYENRETNWNEEASDSIKDEIDQNDIEKSLPKRKRKKRRGRKVRNTLATADENESQKSKGIVKARKEKRSLCWRYFSSVNGKQAKCNKCQKLVQTLGGSTTIMSRHLTKHHPDIFSEFSKLRELQTGNRNTSKKLVPVPKADITLGPKSSVVWDFFIPAGPEAAKCHICGQEYSLGESSGTSQLLRHIMKEHDETYNTLKEKRQQIEDNILLCSMHHPMWKYYTELTGNQYSCNQCNGTIIIKTDTLLVKPLEDHLQQGGHFDEWEEYSKEMSNTDFVYKLKHAIRCVEAAKYSKIWELYEKVDEDHAKCKACETSLGLDSSTILQTFSNYQSGLLRHAKNCHAEVYDKFKEREGRVRYEQIEKGVDRILQVNTPKPKPIQIVISKEGKTKFEDSKLVSLDKVNVIYEGVKETNKVLISDGQTGTEDLSPSQIEDKKDKNEAASAEDMLFSTKKFPGAPKPSIVWNFFQMITQDSTQCKICDKIYITPKGCTSAMKRHLKVNHADYCKRWFEEASKSREAFSTNDTLANTSEEHPIWKHYEEIENDTFNCIHCSSYVKIVNSQIEFLENHLKDNHNDTSTANGGSNVYEEYTHDKLTVTYTKKKDVKPMFAVTDVDADKVWDFPELNNEEGQDTSEGFDTEAELIEVNQKPNLSAFASNAPQHEIIVGGDDSSVGTLSSTFRMAMGTNNLPRRSAVWFFFSGSGIDGNSGANCNACGKLISTTCGSTSLMIRHLKKFHPELSKEFEKYRNTKDLPESITVNFPLPKDATQFGEVVSTMLTDVPNSGVDGSGKQKMEGTEEEDDDEPDEDIPEDPDLVEQNTSTCYSSYKPRRSAVWLFFTAEADKEYSKCNKCDARLKMHSGTTSILFRHLKGFHPKRYRRFMDIRVARGEIPEWKEDDKSKEDSPRKRTKGSPIWNFFTENANESATCNICLQCMSIRHKSTTHLNRHLKSYHPSTYKELRALFTAREAFQKGSEFHHGDSSSMVGLEFTLVRDFYSRVNQELVQCTTCSASLKIPKVMGAGSASSSSLWHHLKNAHEDVHEALTLEKEKIEEAMKLGSEKHPIWKHFKEIEMNTVVCIQCKVLIEMQDLVLAPLEEHMFEHHLQNYQNFKEEMKREDVVASLKKAAEISAKSGLSKLIWSFYKEVSEDHVKCKECGIILGTKDSKSSGLLNHIRHNHNQILQAMTEKGKGMTIKGLDGKSIAKINLGECICESCDKVFSSSTALSFHEKIFHQGVTPYKCEDCDKTFSRSDELRKHQKNHGSKFLCTYCGSQFNTKSSRLRHEQFSHFDVRKFACSQCGKRFHTPQQVRNHLRTHTGEKPFQVRINSLFI